MENSIITEKALVSTENIDPAAESKNSPVAESKHIKRGARNRQSRSRLNTKDATEIFQGTIHRVQDAGITFSLINLPQRVVGLPKMGIVVDGMWFCNKCGVFQYGERPASQICNSCTPSALKG